MRTHGRVAITDSTHTGTLGLNLGLIVDTAPTVTNLDPAIQLELDWYFLTAVAPGHARQAIINGTDLLYGEHFDIRAKRKVSEMGEQLLACYTNPGVNSIALGVLWRVLIALP